MKQLDSFIEKYHKMSIQAKAAIWYSCCNILQKGISFIVIPIYTRMLTTAEYGKYIVFQSWRDLFIIFATLNLYCGVFTKAMVDYTNNRERYTSSMQGLSSVITFILFLIYLIGYNFWNNLLGMDFITIILLFGYYFTYPAFSFWSVRQRVEYKYKRMVFITFCISILTPFLSILLLKFTNLKENAVIWGFLIVQIIVGFFFYIGNFVKGKRFYHKEYWIHALKFNLPLIPHYLSLIVLGQADRIMINSICGADKAGIYGLAYSISQLMIIFISAINGSFVPWIYEQLKKKEYKTIAKTSSLLCIFVGFLSLGAILISPEIIRILGTKEYMEALWIVPVVSLSVYYTFCYGLFSNVEFYFNATNYVMIASTIGAVLNILLNYLLIPVFGYLAAAYTTLSCYALFMVMHYIFMRKICKKELAGIHIFHDAFIILSAIVLFFMMFICMFLYRNTIVRYLVIAIMVVFIMVMPERIKNIIKEVKK